MTGKELGSVSAIVIGLLIAGAQVVREAPWQAGIAIGLFIAFCGAIALADEDEPKPPSDGRHIRPV